MSGDHPDFPLLFNIGTDAELSFSDPDAVKRFCALELKAWKAVLKADFYHHGSAHDHIGAPLENLMGAISNYENDLTASYAINDLRSCLTDLSDKFLQGRAIYSQSALGKFIQSVADDEPSIAAAIYFVATRAGDEQIGLTKTTGIALGYLAQFNSGISKRSAKAAIESIQSKELEFSKIIHETESRSSQLIRAVEDRIIDHDKRAYDLSRRLARSIKTARRIFSNKRNELTSENRSRLENFTADTRKELDDFSDFIKNKIALQGPTKYWEKKRGWHRFSTFVTGFLFVLYLGACAKLVSSTFWSRYKSIFDFLDQWRDAGIGAVALIGGILAVTLMLARVLYRIFASQLHLWNDSSERVTMIQTYLALAEKGHAKEEFLGALLTRLFSPATDGIVRDDLGAIGPIDLASKLTGTRQ